MPARASGTSADGERGGHGFVVEWREGFRTGIEEIDAEHRQLFALVKGLEHAGPRHLLDDLVAYVVTHFAHEEALMGRSGYPGLQRHIEMHESLAGRVSEFLVGGTAWSEQRVQELRTFMNRWLVGHILTHDLHFGRWYHARGPSTEPLPLPEDPNASWFGRLFTRR